MPVLLAAVADVAGLHARRPRQLRGHPAGIGAALLDAEQDMPACAIRVEPEQFLDDEVLRRDANAPAGRR